MVCALALTSCEGFLDVPPTHQADASTCISNVEDAQIMLNGLYSKLTGSSLFGNNLLLIGDAKGGDFTIYTGGFGGDGLYYYDHSITSNTYSGIWSSGYNAILQANNIIANINEMKNEGTNSSTLDDILGQALTIRALLHFEMVRLYGKPYNMDNGASWGIAVVTEPVDAKAQLLRNTVKEVYTQMVADLTEAAPLLSKSNNLGYANYYANQAILGKVYMYMDNFSAAASCFENVINSGKYSLYTPSEWTGSWKTQKGKESILELAIYPNEGDLGGSSIGIYFRKRAHGSSSAYGNLYVSEYWHSLMAENDVRWNIMDYDHMNGQETRSYWKDACYKYSGDLNLAGDGKSTSTAVNIKVIRLSEVYLLAAEALVRGNGDKAKAAEYLNAIAKRNPDYTPWTKDNISADEIYKEYRREMLGEGKLFYEAMRQNVTVQFEDDAWSFGTKPKNTRGASFNRNDPTYGYHMLLPIAESEINTNPEIQQNPGY